MLQTTNALPDGARQSALVEPSGTLYPAYLTRHHHIECFVCDGPAVWDGSRWECRSETCGSVGNAATLEYIQSLRSRIFDLETAFACQIYDSCIEDQLRNAYLDLRRHCGSSKTILDLLEGAGILGPFLSRSGWLDRLESWSPP